MAGEAQLVVDRCAAIDERLFVGGERIAAAAAAAAGRRIQDRRGDDLHAPRLIALHGRLDRGRGIGNLPAIQRQHRLNHDVDARVLRQGPVIVGQRSLAGLVERFAGANRLDAHPRFGIFHLLPHQRRAERAESFERPQRVEAREQVRRGPDDRLQRGDDGLVLLEDQELLRRVAPPAVGMAEMPHELCRGLVVHPRHDSIAPQPVGSIRLDAVVDQSPDATLVDHLVQVVLLDLRAQVGAGSREVPDLDDAVVHVGDVDRPVRRGRHVDGTEVRVERLDELVARIGVVEDRQPLLVLRVDSANDPRHRLA